MKDNYTQNLRNKINIYDYININCNDAKSNSRTN